MKLCERLCAGVISRTVAYTSVSVTAFTVTSRTTVLHLVPAAVFAILASMADASFKDVPELFEVCTAVPRTS